MAYESPNQDIELADQRMGGSSYSFTASSAIKAGQVVKLDGDHSVTPTDTDGEQCVGIATQTKESGEQVQVAGPGVRVRFTAGDSVTAGTQLASHGGTGDPGEVADAATGDYAIGQAFEAGSAGDTVVGMVTVGGQVN